MSEDRRLTEFGDDADNEPADDHDDIAPDQDNASIEPATATYRWQPDSATCEDCGATTERQWLDDGAFVCPDCKSW